MRAGIVALLIYVLFFVGGHPCPVAFARTGEKIGIEKGEVMAILIGYLVGLHFGVVGLYLIGKGEMKSVELMCYGKHTLYGLVQSQVRLEQGVVNLVTLLLEFFRIVSKIPLLKVSKVRESFELF